MAGRYFGTRQAVLTRAAAAVSAGPPYVPVYIEDIFGTKTYLGGGGFNSTPQTITTNIDTLNKGGALWFKDRSISTRGNLWFDTVRGAGYMLSSSGDGTAPVATGLSTNKSNYNSSAFTGTMFTSSGVLLGRDSGYSSINYYGTSNYVMWTFRMQSKFFDIVGYTGTGSATTIAHNLGSVPGCIIVKRTDIDGYNWQVYHNSLTSAAYSIQLNLTSAQASDSTAWNSTAPTSTVFSVGTNAAVNASGGTYIAYIYAHNAAGFGLTGTDNVITCGSVALNGSGTASVTLGYEPQWIMFKNRDGAENWQVVDTGRGITSPGNDAILLPNDKSAETSADYIDKTSTTFTIKNMTASQTYIYVAIRKGPMLIQMWPHIFLTIA